MRRKKQKPRKLTLENNKFVWSRRHVHLKEYKRSPCSEVLTIYLEGNKRCFLRLYFIEDNNPDLRAGYPEDGVVWGKGNYSEFVVNLNRPGIVAAIIRFAMPDVWNPVIGKKPVLIQDGMVWMVKNIKVPDEKGVRPSEYTSNDLKKMDILWK